MNILVVFLLFILLLLYAYKVSIQYELILAQKKKKQPKSAWACWRSGANPEVRNQALMLYPLFFPVDISDDDNDLIRDKKASVKRVNILLYWFLIMALLIAVYLGKTQ